MRALCFGFSLLCLSLFFSHSIPLVLLHFSLSLSSWHRGSNNVGDDLIDNFQLGFELQNPISGWLSHREVVLAGDAQGALWCTPAQPRAVGRCRVQSGGQSGRNVVRLQQAGTNHVGGNGSTILAVPISGHHGDAPKAPTSVKHFVCRAAVP